LRNPARNKKLARTIIVIRSKLLLQLLFSATIEISSEQEEDRWLTGEQQSSLAGLWLVRDPRRGLNVDDQWCQTHDAMVTPKAIERVHAPPPLPIAKRNSPRAFTAHAVVVRNRVRSAIHCASQRTEMRSNSHRQPTMRYVGPHEWLLRRRLRACDRCCSVTVVGTSAPFARDAPPWYVACFRVGFLYKRPA